MFELCVASEVAAATGEFAQSVVDLAASDVGPQLSAELAGLGDVEKTAQELQNKQSQEDTVTIMSTGELVIEHFLPLNDCRSMWNMATHARF